MDMRTCLVTGANRGLGLEFTRQLLAAGAHVVATCRQPGKASALNGLAGEHPGRLRVLPLDVANPKSIAELERAQIGRAQCRERVCEYGYISVRRGSKKKK